MISIDCDHCKKPITDVCYEIVPTVVDTARRLYPSNRVFLHYNCIVPWRQQDA